MKVITRVLVGMASGALVVGGVVPAAADSGQLTISVKGLPASSELATGLRLQVVGPTGQAKTRTWRVTGPKTVKGLQPGTYVVQARKVRTKDGHILGPKLASTWVTVADNQQRTATVRYRPWRRQSDPPQEPVDLNAACRFMFSPDAKAGWDRYENPYSIFCLPTVSALNLDFYCRHYKGMNAYVASLQGGTVADWWCVRRT